MAWENFSDFFEYADNPGHGGLACPCYEKEGIIFAEGRIVPVPILPRLPLLELAPCLLKQLCATPVLKRRFSDGFERI